MPHSNTRNFFLSVLPKTHEGVIPTQARWQAITDVAPIAIVEGHKETDLRNSQEMPGVAFSRCPPLYRAEGVAGSAMTGQSNMLGALREHDLEDDVTDQRQRGDDEHEKD